jgi:uncharacterized protein (TIGR02284 family)
MDRTETIGLLNDLIEVSRDGEQGFRSCAQAVSNPSLVEFFELKAERCALAAEQLHDKVRELGGEPSTGGSASGAAHRFWLNIRSTLTGMDDNAVLAECERGEDYAKGVYEDALRTDMPPDVRVMVAKQYQEVRANHDRIKDMRNATA